MVQCSRQREKRGGRTLYLNQWGCGGNAAQWGLTLRAGGEKQFQGQHGNITFSRYKAAMSCGEAMPEQESGQRTAGERTRSRTRSDVSKRSDNMARQSETDVLRGNAEQEEKVVDLTSIGMISGD